MTKIDLTDSPRDIFIAAARDAARAGLVLAKAREAIAAEEAAAANAQANLQWVAAHPALAEVDKAALYQEAAASVTLEDAEADEDSEPEKPAESAPPKRKRRTKAEIEADKKAKEDAEKSAAPEANESDNAAQQVEGAGVSAPAAPPVADDFDPFGQGAQVAPAQPVGSPEVGGPPAAVQGAPTPPPAAVAGSDPFDPFGVGAN